MKMFIQQSIQFLGIQYSLSTQDLYHFRVAFVITFLQDVKTFLVPTNTPFVLSIIQIFSNWIVLNTFIPISLYVT